MLRRLVLVVALAAAAAGCDADAIEQNDDRDPQEDVVRAGLATLYADGDPAPAVAAEAACFADAVLERLDLDELVRAGVVEDDGNVTRTLPMLDVDVAEAWVDAQAACVDYVVTSTRAELARDPGLDPAAYRSCFDRRLTADQVREALVRALSGRFDSPEVDELSAVQDECARRALSPG